MIYLYARTGVGKTTDGRSPVNRFIEYGHEGEKASRRQTLNWPMKDKTKIVQDVAKFER